MVEAYAIRLFIVVGECEAEKVGRASSQIKPRIGPPARLEAIKIKATVHAVSDAVPTECAMDGRQLLLRPECGPLQDALKGEPEAVHEIGSGGQGLKVFLRSEERRVVDEGRG